MRWDRLWSDLEAQADALDRDEFDAEVADRSVRERAAVALMDRLRASVGRVVRCRVVGGRGWQGTLVGHGSDWIALRIDEVGGLETVVVPVSALRSCRGLSGQAVPEQAVGLLARRLDLRLLLRRVMADRLQVRAVLDDGSAVAGDVVGVGSDYLDLRDPDGIVWSLPLGTVAGYLAR